MRRSTKYPIYADIVSIFDEAARNSDDLTLFICIKI